MTAWEAVLLGAVQGLFMFIPVSSTGHLALTQHLLIALGSDLPSPESAEMILFDLVVHVGTLVSIVVVFRRSLGRFVGKIVSGTRAALRRGGDDRLHLRLALLGLLTVAVTGAVGFPLQSLSFLQGPVAGSPHRHQSLRRPRWLGHTSNRNRSE